MLSLSAIAKLVKNKPSDTGAWLILLEVDLETETLYLVRNTEDITFDSQIYTAFPFDLSEISEDSKGEIPKLTIKVSNINRVVQGYLEACKGGVGKEITLKVVHSDNLISGVAEISETFIIRATTCDEQWCSFTCQGEYGLQSRRPQQRYMKDFCMLQFKGCQCAYAGAETTCNKTYTRCLELENQMRFGGEIGIVGTNLYR